MEHLLQCIAFQNHDSQEECLLTLTRATEIQPIEVSVKKPNMVTGIIVLDLHQQVQVY